MIYKRSYLGRNPPKGVTLAMKSTSPSLMGTLFKEAAWLSG